MSLTIGEVLENAEYNLNSKEPFQLLLGKDQLKNAIYLLNEKDKSVNDTFNEDDLPKED